MSAKEIKTPFDGDQNVNGVMGRARSWVIKKLAGRSVVVINAHIAVVGESVVVSSVGHKVLPYILRSNVISLTSDEAGQ